MMGALLRLPGQTLAPELASACTEGGRWIGPCLRRRRAEGAL